MPLPVSAGLFGLLAASGLLAGAIVSFATAFLVLFIAYKLLKIPFGLAIGMMAAVHTQPAVQAYAVAQAKNATARGVRGRRRALRWAAVWGE